MIFLALDYNLKANVALSKEHAELVAGARAEAGYVLFFRSFFLLSQLMNR